MSNRSEGRRIAVAYAVGLSSAGVSALAERIDRAIGAAKKRGEKRGARKAEGEIAAMGAAYRKQAQGLRWWTNRATVFQLREFHDYARDAEGAAQTEEG